MYFGFTIVVYMMLMLDLCSSANYCGAKMCGGSNDHTFCMYPPGPGPDCVGFIKAQLTANEKVRILARLNKRRKEAAWGSRGMPKAANMLKLVWVEELAREAQLWADQCAPIQNPEENDFCRDLYSVPVGQCVASLVGEAPGLRPESLVDIWHMQSRNYQWNVSYVPPSAGGPNYADYVQIIWAKCYMVGCARSRFMTSWRGRLRTVERLVCNFAPRGPPPGLPLWLPGPEETECPTHSEPDLEYPGLCVYHSDLNETDLSESDSTIEEDILLITVFEIEDNKALNFLGNLDEIYLSRMKIAQSLQYTQPNASSLRNRDLSDSMESTTLKTEIHVPTGLNTGRFENKTIRTILNVVGRPKPYDLDELDHIEAHTENLRKKKNMKREAETSTDLQEALTQREVELSNNTMSDAKKGKIRRDVKGPDGYPGSNNKNEDDDEEIDEPTKLGGKIRRVSTERVTAITPVNSNSKAVKELLPTGMNMLFQFMPFLQKFQNVVGPSGSCSSVSSYPVTTTAVAIFLLVLI